MTPHEVIDVFVICLWAFLSFWVFGVGGLLLSVNWWRVKRIGKQAKEIAIDLSILGPFLIPLAVWILCETLGGR